MIAERLNQFLKHLGVTAYQFEKEVGLSKNSIAVAIKNNTTIGSEALGKIFSKHSDINLEWLISGEGKMLKENSIKNISQKENTHLINTPIHTPNSKSKDLGVHLANEPEATYQLSTLPVKVMDVEAAAAAFTGGYLTNRAEVLDIINLPASMLSRSGEHYAFKVRNDSMHPTIYVGDYIVAQLLTPSQYTSIRDNYIYVVICKENGVVVKRILNRLQKYGFLRCRSDNRFYPPFNVEEQNIVAVLDVKLKISGNLPNENQNLFEAISALQERVETIEIENRLNKR